jgi:molybdate transport system substrate-binding protein
MARLETMFHHVARCLSLSLLAFLVVSCRPSGEENATVLTIYAAASLTDVLPALGNAFAEETSVQFQYNFAGSGALAQQILLAPRADIFLSANQRWMDELEQVGRIVPESRFDFASNQLCVIANAESPFTVERPEDIATLPITWLALGDPAAVPVGWYAKTWMEGIAVTPEKTLWDALQNRLSPTPDVRAALAQIASREDIVGVVYASDLAAMTDESVRILYRVPLERGPPIRYPAAMVRESRLARAFLNFLQSDRARGILEEFGFLAMPDSTPSPSESIP